MTPENEMQAHALDVPRSLSDAAMLLCTDADVLRALMDAGVIPNVGTTDEPAVTLAALRSMDLHDFAPTPEALLSVGALAGHVGALARLRNNLRDQRMATMSEDGPYADARSPGAADG